MSYTYDADLEFLAKCNDNELKSIVDILSYNNDSIKKYLDYNPNWKIIKEYYLDIGGKQNGTSPFSKYNNILNYILIKVGISYSQSASLEFRETQLLEQVFSYILNYMSETEKMKLIDFLNIKVEDYSKISILLSIQKNIENKFLLDYKLSIIVIKYIEMSLKEKNNFFLKMKISEIDIVNLIYMTLMISCLRKENQLKKTNNSLNDLIAEKNKGIQLTGIIYSNISISETNLGMDKIVNNKQGHGFAAEKANHLSDILSGKNAQLVGDNNLKNGPDRIVNGSYIQTKYCRNPQSCINECFDNNGKFRYSYEDINGNLHNMSIEVPSDMYDGAVKAMAKKIEEGKVPGVNDPGEAKKIVKKGAITYQQAKNIAKAGNIDGILFDAKNGIIISTKTFGISVAITFATSIWNGEEFEVALKNATWTGLKITGLSFISSIFTSQLSRTVLNKVLIGATDVVIKGMGPKASAYLVNAFRSGGEKMIHGAAAMKSASKLIRGNIIAGGVTSVILSVGDVVNIFRGRISGAQLFKNVTTTVASVAGGTAGWVGGAATGAAIGSFIPIVGTTICAVFGGLVGAFAGGSKAQSVTKAALDTFIEEDADEMVRILEKVFADVANEYLINKKEATTAIDKLKNIIDGSILKDMYASSSRGSFARNLIEPIIEKIAYERKKIILPTDEQLLDKLNEIFEELAVEEENEDRDSLLYASITSRW